MYPTAEKLSVDAKGYLRRVMVTVMPGSIAIGSQEEIAIACW
jgi:hypothetical protein